MSKPKVLVTFIESGKGHIMSAASVAESLKEKYGSRFDIEESYIMSEDCDKRLIKMEKFLAKQVQNTNKIHYFGSFIFFMMRLLGSQKLMRFVHRNLTPKIYKALLSAFEKRKPDVIISTHYYITFMANEYKRKIDSNCTVITYNPDNNVHIWWDSRSGYFLLNNEKAYRQALKRGFKEENLGLVSFAYRKELEYADKDKSLYRKKYGIDNGKFTVTLADGAYMMGNAKRYCKALLKSKAPLNILLIAGTNEKEYRKFSALIPRLPDNITLKVFPFMPEAYELYCAADMFVTKSGPNSILDSIQMGTPVMVNYIPHNIERGTYKLFVEELGCGIGVFDKRKAKKFIEKMAADPSLLLPYMEKAEVIRKKPNGADSVSDFVFERLKARGFLCEKKASESVFVGEEVPRVIINEDEEIQAAVR